MTPLPALSDVIRETLTEKLWARASSAWHEAYGRHQSRDEAHAKWLDVLLSALLLPLTEREQGLRERITAQSQAIRNAEVALWKNRVVSAEARVSALTAERDDLADELASCEFCSRPFVAQREGGTIPCRIACCTDCWNSQHNAHLHKDIERLTAEREALWTLAREAANGWACYAKRKVELDDIHRIHQALHVLAGAPHAPTQEKGEGQ